MKEEELHLHLHLVMHCLQLAKLAHAPPESHRLTHLDLESPPQRHCAMQRRGGAHAGQSCSILFLMQSAHTLPSAGQPTVNQTAVIRITTSVICNDLMAMCGSGSNSWWIDIERKINRD